MATGQEIIDRATQLLRVRAAGVTYATDDSAMNTECFIVLQNMLASWAEQAIIDIPAPALVGDTLDISEGDVRGIVYNFAVEIAPLYGRPSTAEVVGIASETKDQLEADMAMDIGITHESAIGGSSRYNIRQGG